MPLCQAYLYRVFQKENITEFWRSHNSDMNCVTDFFFFSSIIFMKTAFSSVQLLIRNERLFIGNRIARFFFINSFTRTQCVWVSKLEIILLSFDRSYIITRFFLIEPNQVQFSPKCLWGGGEIIFMSGLETSNYIHYYYFRSNYLFKSGFIHVEIIQLRQCSGPALA